MPVVSWVLIGISLSILGFLGFLVVVYIWIGRHERVYKRAFARIIGRRPKEIGELDGMAAIALDVARRELLVGTMDSGNRPIVSKIDLRQVVHCEAVENEDQRLALAVRWEGNSRQMLPILAESEAPRRINCIRLRLNIKGQAGANELTFFHESDKAGEEQPAPDSILVGMVTSETLKWHRRISELLDPGNLPEPSRAQYGSCMIRDKIISGMTKDRGRCDACNRDDLPLRHAYFWHGAKASETTQSLVDVKENSTPYLMEGPVPGMICCDCILRERRSKRKWCAMMAGITALLGWGACTVIGGAIDSLGWQMIICIIGGIFLLGLLSTAFESEDDLADQLLIKSREVRCREAGSTKIFSRQEYKQKTKMADIWLREIV